MENEEKAKDVDIPEDYEVHYLEMSDGIRLRCLSFRPQKPRGNVYMYPGMNTLVMSWIRVLEGLMKENYRVEYVESREKYTAKYPGKINLDKERMITDCAESAEKLNLNDGEYITIGSSLGSTTLIHCMASNSIKPKHAVLVGPTPHLKVPWAIRIILPLVTPWTYRHIGKPIMKKIALRKFTDEKADPMQKRKYELALELAEPIRLKKTLNAWAGNKIWDILNQIDGETTTCHLIGASEDKLHPDEETRNVSEMIVNAKFVDLKTNTAAHDQPLIDMILELK